ncbi:MAG: hypothetical protein HPY73_00120 [Methanomassiliicoccales archaeon]|nr:MAG: hypothetical protein HPY73_00120 [Methanomassiliicoccales archaeon]
MVLRMNDVQRFIARIKRSSRLKAPRWSVALISSRLSPEVKAWMERNQIKIEELSSAALTDLMMVSTASMICALLCSLLLEGVAMLVMIGSLSLIPFLSTVSLVQAPARFVSREETEMLMESTSVVGLMSMSMLLSPSIERAVSYASEHGDGPLSTRLRSVCWEAAVAWSSDVGTGLVQFSSSLSEEVRDLKLSLQMIMTAATERSRIGLERLLEKANHLVVQGTKERMDRYVNSLSFPTMVLFAFGVLLPVMLFSLVPMLDMKLMMGDPRAVSSIGSEQAAFLMLVIFPTCTFLFARSTLIKHPMRKQFGPSSIETRSILFMVALAFFIGVTTYSMKIYRPYLTVFLVAIVPSIFAYTKFIKVERASKEALRSEKELVMALFQVGNYMLSGSSMESALLTTSRSIRSESFKKMVSEIMHRLQTEGLTMEQAFRSCKVLSNVSSLTRNAFLTVARSSSLDPRSSGMIAVNLAKYISELRESERKGRERIRSVIEMMSYTSMLFAPIVIGVTGSLYELVSGITGFEGSSQLTIVGGLYVIELCAIVSYFNAGLLGEGDLAFTICDFARRVPVAALAFIATSLIAGHWLSSLF